MVDEQQVRAESLKFLEEEELAYQSVTLPGGVVTPGHDRAYMFKTVFGDEFTGKSYFDIGSYLGHFCIEALRRGAVRSCGIETDVSHVRRAQRIAGLLSMKPEYINGNFERWVPPNETFDVVTCLNVLHHLTDPINAIRKIMQLSKSRIVLEVAKPTWREVLKDHINPLRLAGLGSPAIFLGKPKKRGYIAGRTYMFTPQALRIIFNVHSNLFEPISITSSPFKGRLVVVAQKKSIGHLVVVAGPTSSGKSTLCARLREDGSLQQQFGMQPGSWPLVGSSEVPKMLPGRRDQLIFHYDFLRPSRTSIHSFDRDPSLDLLKVAETVTILTVATPRHRLAEQLQKGEIERKGRKPRERDLQLLKLYGTPQFLNDWYNAWDSFGSSFPAATRMVVENCGEFRRAAQDDWSAVLEQGVAGQP
ncbi:MAG: class I SAM-dependent methyltransferase [Aestuariivirga sp.]|nr:class I SAM-dependent methyltransferase [Aestuariivirga sp.]